MASSRDWNAVLLKTITSGPKAPAVLMLLEDDPQLYVVRCSEITSEVCAVFDAIEAGLPTSGASEVFGCDALPEDVSIVYVVKKRDEYVMGQGSTV